MRRLSRPLALGIAMLAVAAPAASAATADPAGPGCDRLDDAACLEILEPYRGHRYRVQLLLSLSAARRPRRAPRMTLPTHTPYATKGRS